MSFLISGKSGIHNEFFWINIIRASILFETKSVIGWNLKKEKIEKKKKTEKKNNRKISRNRKRKKSPRNPSRSSALLPSFQISNFAMPSQRCCLHGGELKGKSRVAKAEWANFLRTNEHGHYSKTLCCASCFILQERKDKVNHKNYLIRPPSLRAPFETQFLDIFEKTIFFFGQN